jgi:hypothetical protein
MKWTFYPEWPITLHLGRFMRPVIVHHQANETAGKGLRRRRSESTATPDADAVDSQLLIATPPATSRAENKDVQALRENLVHNARGIDADQRFVPALV